VQAGAARVKPKAVSVLEGITTMANYIKDLLTQDVAGCWGLLTVAVGWSIAVLVLVSPTVVLARLLISLYLSIMATQQVSANTLQLSLHKSSFTVLRCCDCN
jgi:hypothetical protein